MYVRSDLSGHLHTTYCQFVLSSQILWLSAVAIWRRRFFSDEEAHHLGHGKQACGV
jgi:hypothetical protein